MEKHEQEIFDKIEEIYNSVDKSGSPKGKNFVTHLMRAYFPVGKCQRVLDVPEKSMKCAITGQKLFAVGELWNEMQNPEFFKSMTKSMIARIDPEAEKVENPMAKIANGRVIGLTGEKTDTYLCQEAYQQLYNWMATKLLTGDKHINWVMKSMRSKEMVNHIKKVLPEEENKPLVKRAEQLANHPKKATLGDLSILQQIKEKMEAKEKENGR